MGVQKYFKELKNERINESMDKKERDANFAWNKIENGIIISGDETKSK